MSWETVKTDCLICRKCSLCETRTNVVFGVGDPNAEVMFIGEAPGEQEDLSGEPFVGRGGKLLDELMDGIGLNRSKVFIANIVKCRPPKNRDPLPTEKASCIDWLHMQTTLIQPKIIVCVGRIAGQILIKQDLKITKEHGTWFEINDVLMMATLHPAALLRDPRRRSDSLGDFQKLRQKVLEICESTEV